MRSKKLIYTFSIVLSLLAMLFMFSFSSSMRNNAELGITMEKKTGLIVISVKHNDQIPQLEKTGLVSYALGAKYPGSKYIIAYPEKNIFGDNTPINALTKILVDKGISPERILPAIQAKSIRTQALKAFNIAQQKGLDTVGVRVVVPPYSMMRTIAVFNKAGFGNVGGVYTYEETPVDSSIANNPEKMTEIDNAIANYSIRPGEAGSITYKINVLSEGLAMFYYRLRGWI